MSTCSAADWACGDLENPHPELFPHVFRRRLVIRIRDHLVQSRNEVHILRFDELALHHVTRDSKQDRSEHQRYVIGDEGRSVPVTPEEHRETAEEEDYADRDDTIPRRVGLERGFEWEEVSVEALGVPTGSEPDVSDADPKPSHQSSNGSHVLEPAEDFSWTRANTHVGDERKKRTERHGDPWKPILGRPAEEPRSLTVQ